MSIDWVTVLAQIVNFLVLVYLLKRFLYRPVIDAMERRQQRIADRLAEAEQRERDAAEEEASYRASREQLEEQREALEREAREDAEETRRELREAARSEVESQREQWLADLQREQAGFLDRLRRLLADEILAATRQLLSDLADSSLDERMARRLAARLRDADEKTRAAFAATEAEVVVASDLELGQGAREALSEAIDEVAGREIQPRFEGDPEVQCGIELRLDGYRLAWTAQRYLETIERRVAEQFEAAG